MSGQGRLKPHPSRAWLWDSGELGEEMPVSERLLGDQLSV